MLNPLFCWRSSIARNSSLLTGFIENTFAGKDRKKPFTLKWVFYRGLTINDDKEVITGTITSYTLKADEITFKNSKNETVWMQMTRKK